MQRLAEPLQAVSMSNDIIAAVQHESMPIYGVQFHPEVNLTVHGKNMIGNFLFKVCMRVCKTCMHVSVCNHFSLNKV